MPSRAGLLLIVAVIAFAATSCRDTSYSRTSAELPNPDENNAPNDGQVEPSCQYELQGVALSTTLATFEGLTHPAVADGRVIVERTGTVGSNAEWDAEIVAIDPLTGQEEQLTFNDRLDALVDADGTSIVYLREDDDGTRLVWWQSGEERVLEGSENARPDVGFGAPAHVVESDHLVWRDSDGLLRLESPGGSQVVSRGDIARQPYLRDGAVVWVEAVPDGNDWEIFYFDGQTTERLTDNTGHESFPMLTRDWIVYLNHDAIPAAIHRETGEYRPLGDNTETCNYLTASADLAAWICFNQSDPRYTIKTFDGDEVATLLMSGSTILAAAVDGRRLVWAEYEGLTAGCEPSEGRLMYRESPDTEPIEIARIGSGCYCCGALWPPVNLALDDDIVAWNYAHPQSLAPGTMFVGYAVLDRVCER